MSRYLTEADIQPEDGAMLLYKGYRGRVELDDEAGIFHGEVIDLKDVVTFQGTSVEEIEAAFRESIDDYLEFCAETPVTKPPAPRR
jgi:predicted HicB family RNase H-like nuclease